MSRDAAQELIEYHMGYTFSAYGCGDEPCIYGIASTGEAADIRLYGPPNRLTEAEMIVLAGTGNLFGWAPGDRIFDLLALFLPAGSGGYVRIHDWVLANKGVAGSRNQVQTDWEDLHFELSGTPAKGGLVFSITGVSAAGEQ